ncbi:hypothetical protein Aph02nite_81270 [Actinoplanes philippinensis]|uniref:Uncharacterized protein n=1 Tax=Actinoplanes philippinensis TaxID=35752 RepID=A0A1I2KZF1_9ACTN|nr:hypothetical protein [Actinoplanes philippinensis]GIE82177.1 hypothetical protein Aph02nite_81270 [Actinoplanes philippinensis]SFF70266.1 hypothetical protein SAMN05421541_118138 [Actinoplanes philippinensis]
MIISGPFPQDVRIGTAGLTLVWPRRSPEAGYSGTEIRWSEIRDADPDAYPPELRVGDGPCRTVFIGRDRHHELTAGLAAAGVPLRRRPDVWADLLEPFLDTEYDDATRAQAEGRLSGWGFSDAEIRSIRRRVHVRMTALTLATWEWAGYGHSDVLLATSRFPASRYLAFRAWADAVAARSDAA